MNWKAAAFGLLLVAALGLGKTTLSYRAQYAAAAEQAAERQATIDDMQQRRQAVAALDAKLTGELTNAQATITQLQRDISAGRRRLQLAVTCPQQPAASAASLANATSARLTDAAERDYFTLRYRIEVAGKQIAGLQQYIREQCLK
ncbi:lysis protein [Erwinia phyllosphaerae]|uniref:lysis protein n=1 Tax=Erwinia phyllosphaerae TaxID=2853256 RepID=UPI001FEF6D12|nr:lysis protein [Erwinia phyllosphaerae]MBV4366273.1 lysis protein [Erwinia phyllosphaerae]